MEIIHKDFIGVYKNVLSVDTCNNLIQLFEKHLALNPSSTMYGATQMPHREMARKDTSLIVNGLLPNENVLINNALNACIAQYSEEFFVIKQIEARSETIKMQKTAPKGGYHAWHSEVSSYECASRVLAWTLYLNDIPDGEGETEFLWQGVRVKPEAGTVCIFPAAFTHTHRGNPVYSCDKYIATGWYTLIPNLN
jgi:hypothetical protein